jgi:hypothetical protein
LSLLTLAKRQQAPVLYKEVTLPMQATTMNNAIDFNQDGKQQGLLKLLTQVMAANGDVL